MGFDRVCGAEFASRSMVLGRRGMAATSQPLATQVALDMLRRGGSAMDAAIAANALLGLVEPTGCGVGGDLFALVWDASEKALVGLNASGRSPRGLSLEALRGRGITRMPQRGPLSVSVPGAVDGWCTLHRRFGRLSFAELFAPAIEYAESGFPVTQLITHEWAENVKVLAEFPGFLEVFAPGGAAPEEGDIFRNPALAETYRAIAEGGRDAFYTGDIARTIASYLNDNGGFLTVEDLASHHSDWVQPVSTSYRGCEVWELPPNGQGIAALQILNILEGYELAQLDRFGADFVHLFTEAKKLAFEDRARFYADPDFADVPVDALISREYASQRRSLIDPLRAAARVAPGNPALGRGDTVYLTTADEQGNMVSLIQSNYRGMGSGMTPPGLGFCLQNRGEMFSLADNHPSVYAPGKRPFHTIIPAFITRGGRPWVSFGVMGGAAQPQMHAQVVINLVDYGMNLQEAGDAARILHNGSSEPTGELMVDGGSLSLERGYSPSTRTRLADMGHRLRYARGDFGGYQAIMRNDNGVYSGASESRKDGCAAGY